MSSCGAHPPPSNAQELLDAFMVGRQHYLTSCLGLTRCAETRWELDPSVHDAPRHFAATSEDGLVIYVAPELFGLPLEHQQAILLHEWGHAVDFLYPAEIVVEQNGFPGVREPTKGALQAWKDRDKDTVEGDADKMVERLWGTKIRYTGPCCLQAFSGGKPSRPRGLRLRDDDDDQSR